MSDQPNPKCSICARTNKNGESNCVCAGSPLRPNSIPSDGLFCERCLVSAILARGEPDCTTINKKRPLSARLIQRFAKKKQIQRWIKSQFPGVPQDFIDSTSNCALAEVSQMVHRQAILCLSEFFKTGRISRSAYIGFIRFSYGLTRNVARQAYRKLKSDKLLTNAEKIDVIDRRVVHNVDGENDEILDRRLFVVDCLRHARGTLDDMGYRALRLRMKGATYLEIGMALAVDRNKASNIVDHSSRALSEFVESNLPPLLFGRFIKLEVERSERMHQKSRDCFNRPAPSYADLLPEDPALLIAKLVISHLNKVRRKRRNAAFHEQLWWNPGESNDGGGFGPI